MDINLDRMSSMLDSYKKLLERERDLVVRQQFNDFAKHLGLQEEEIETYYQSFQTMLSEVDHDTPLSQKLKACVESSFFTDILTAKTSNRERELRKITHLLSVFIQKSADNSTSDEQFIQNILAETLRTAADAIQTEKSEDQTLNEAWLDSLKLGYEIFLGRKL